eukprot:TRINITY_DN0_c5_g1_i1.p1 TRINITY_DN0_c5_g1~~TRINITY_DN0_c5_g1_i1.p1  ORF type:complete len:214 (-),score=21.58 TRINITY_DN0_c5_g1_i1:70-711(-)
MGVLAVFQLKYVVPVFVVASVILSLSLLARRWGDSDKPTHKKLDSISIDSFLNTFQWTSRDGPNDLTQVSCRNTKQGVISITDDRGYHCKRLDVDPQTSCCTNSQPTIFFTDHRLLRENELENMERFSCKGCEENRCCKDFEVCVSCCLDPDKKGYLEGLVVSNLPLYSHVTDQFELCTQLCRTSSRTLYHEREYKSDVLKYCFSNSGPPIKK